MIGKNLYPVFAISFILLSFIQKIYVNIFNGIERGIDLYVILLTPLYFFRDIPVALIIFIIMDIPLYFLSYKGNRLAYKIVRFFYYIIFFVIVIYSFLVLKFYGIFGTFLTYGHAIQAHRIENYSGGIINEMDKQMILLFISGLIYFTATIIINNKFSDKNSKGEFKYMFKSIKDINAGKVLRRIVLIILSFLLYIIISIPVVENIHKSKNLYSIDNNPLYEIVQSAFEAGMVRGDKNTDGMNSGMADANDKKYPEPFISDSVIARDSIIRGIDLKVKDVNLLSNMNVVFYLLESTSGIYTDEGNREFKGYIPNIHKIASGSLYLANHYCQEPASIKSLYSILTGRFPYKTRDWWHFLNRTKKDITIAEILKKSGYNTAFFTTQDGTIYYLNSFLKGRFDTVIDKEIIKRKGWNYRDFTISLDDRVLIRLFDDYLAGQKGKFFAFISAMFPHHPYITPSSEFIKNGGGRAIDKYKNSLYYSDFVIGEIFNLLKKYGIEKNTIFVLFSDHGEAFYQHPGNFLHSIYLYEENVKTFCLINNPVLINREIFNNITRHIDITPTILDLLMINYEGYGIDGVSLLKPHRHKFSPFYTGFSKEYFGLRDMNWKYIINFHYNSEELYDLSQDAAEKNNLAPAFEDIRKVFKEKLIKLNEYVK